MSQETKHTISTLVDNDFGVLSRVSGMFSGRGFNIESLSVATTLDPTVSRITLTVFGDATVLEQITRQLEKLIPVIKVVDFRGEEHVSRELALIKVRFDGETRSEVMNAVAIFRARVMDVGQSTCIIEVTGGEGKVDAMVRLLNPLGIREIARTGSAALYRGERLLTVQSESEKS